VQETFDGTILVSMARLLFGVSREADRRVIRVRLTSVDTADPMLIEMLTS